MLFRYRKSNNPLSSTSYGIMRACHRCVYQKSYESVVIVSEIRGPRIIILMPEGKLYRRESKECLGMDKCGKCIKVVKGEVLAPCEWKEI